jgi:PAS domain S-box-containing protein
MIEITKVGLENEMDVILAHKQSMRLAELAGLSISGQTTFATAVSEISRTALADSKQARLILCISERADKVKFVSAVLEDEGEAPDESDEGYKYARKLVSDISMTTSGGTNRIVLNYRLPSTTRIDNLSIEKWQIILNNDPAISPYEEIKRKNRQLAELAEKLQESEQQYKILTDSLPIMIVSVNKEGVITYANKWVTDYTGQTIEYINNSKWRDIIHPDDFAETWETWESNLESQTMIVRPERRLRNKDSGEYRWHTGIATPVHDEKGVVRCWNTFLVDIHAQKMIEEALKDNFELKEIQAELTEKVNQLNQSNQQLEQFAYVASHDLQEPLRKISFYSDYLKQRYRGALPEEAMMFFENLMNASERMKVLIQDILSYSTVRKAVFENVDLNNAMNEVLQDLEISIREKDAEIEVSYLPLIEGNERQLKQLFENLISNSLKYSKEGVRPLITVAAEQKDEQVILSFTDNGIGFEENYINKMFSIFQRLHTRDKFAGTGIGLAICKKIVDLHGGEISARSKAGEGSVFTITLPANQK